MVYDRHLKKNQKIVLINIVNSLLKFSNKTANINVKKLQFIHNTATYRKPQKS